MIALSFSFIKNYLSLLECQDSADTDLSIVKRVSITSFFFFFFSSNWFDNISMKEYDDIYFKDDDNDEN